MQAPTDQTITEDPQISTSRADAIDDALDRLSGYAYADGPGMATHGPMGAEAMSTLGHDDLVGSWAEAYKSRHEPLPAPPKGEQLDPADEASWRSALGDPGRLSDWQELFTHALEEQPWTDVLAHWVPQLLPGYGGAFTHGLIRTAHAVRAVQWADTPSSLVMAELAKGLAYWAGSYKTLPGRPELRGTLSLDEAISQVPRPDQAWTMIEAGQFSRIGELAGFAEAVEALGPPASLDEALSELTVTYARMMLANPDVHPFGLVHAITPVSGARTLLPYLPDLPTVEVYAQLWQVNAAIVAGMVPDGRPGADTASLGEPPAPDDLTARAAEHKDPHVVKFTETCLREHVLRSDPAYLLAAQHVLHKTPAW